MLAAGMGKRLGEFTKNNTKCMVEVNGVKLIDRVITFLSKLNIDRLVIVVGYQGQNLIDHIGTRYDDILKIEYITNPIYDRTNNIYSLALAKEEMCKDDTILLESDLIYDFQILHRLVNHPDRDLAVIAKYEPWMDGTMVCLDSERNITSFVSKQAFSYDHTDIYYKTVNIYKFSKEFFSHYYLPFLDAYCTVMGNNEYYEQVLNVLTMLHNSPLKALPLTDERWYEIDDAQDLDIASCLFSDSDQQFRQYHRRYGGFWRFPQLIDFCYLVNPYFPPAKMVSEMKSNYEVLLTNYPSGMSVNSLLAAKYFGINTDYVVVGNGAAELIKSLMTTLDGPLGVVYPTFEEYPNRRPSQTIVPFIPTDEYFQYSADELMTFFADKSLSSLLLINPDNPSGNFIPYPDLLRLCQWTAERGITFVLDESFVDFSDDFLHNSLLHNDLLTLYPNLIVVKSISKSYGVPGLRLGILATSRTDLIAHLKRDVAIWNINSFAEYYMQIFGKYSKDYTLACQSFIAERTRFQQQLQSVPHLHVVPTQANFFLLRIEPPYSATDLAHRLLSDHNILVKDCNTKHGLEGKNFLRIAIRDRHDNDLLVQALRDLFGL